MDEFSTTHSRDFQRQGSSGWLIVSILAIVLLLVGIVWLGAGTGGDGTADPALPGTAAPEPVNEAPVVTE